MYHKLEGVLAGVNFTKARHINTLSGAGPGHSTLVFFLFFFVVVATQCSIVGHYAQDFQAIFD